MQYCTKKLKITYKKICKKFNVGDLQDDTKVYLAHFSALRSTLKEIC